MIRRHLIFGAFAAVAAPPADERLTPKQIQEREIVAGLAEGFAWIAWARPWLPVHRRDEFSRAGLLAMIDRMAARYGVAAEDIAFLANRHFAPAEEPDRPNP